jgi:hypothetical protein
MQTQHIALAGVCQMASAMLSGNRGGDQLSPSGYDPNDPGRSVWLDAFNHTFESRWKDAMWRLLDAHPTLADADAPDGDAAYLRNEGVRGALERAYALEVHHLNREAEHADPLQPPSELDSPLCRILERFLLGFSRNVFTRARHVQHALEVRNSRAHSEACILAAMYSDSTNNNPQQRGLSVTEATYALNRDEAGVSGLPHTGRWLLSFHRERAHYHGELWGVLDLCGRWLHPDGQERVSFDDAITRLRGRRLFTIDQFPIGDDSMPLRCYDLQEARLFDSRRDRPAPRAAALR